MKKVIKVVLAVFVIALVIIVGKDIVDNGFANSRTSAVVNQVFNNEATAPAVAIAPATTVAPDPTVPTATIAPAATDDNVITFGDFIIKAQANQYGVLNATFGEAEPAVLSEAEKLLGSYVTIIANGDNISVIVEGETFKADSDSAKEGVELQICDEHKALRNAAMSNGTAVRILVTEELVAKIQTIACRWSNAEGEYVYGVKICKHKKAGGNGGGSGGNPGGNTPVPPTDVPVIPTKPPVVPTDVPVIPTIPPVNPTAAPRPSHSPQKQVSDKPVSPEKQKILDEDQGEFWTTGEKPVVNPKHSEQSWEHSGAAEYTPAHSSQEGVRWQTQDEFPTW